MRKTIVNLIFNLPVYYQHSKVLQIVLYPFNRELDHLSDKINALRRQMNVSTSDYAIEEYEKEYGVEKDVNLSIEERRNKIISKMKSTGTTTIEKIKSIVKTWTGENCQITEEYNDYSFTVKIKNAFQNIAKMDGAYEAIEEVKPAHLQVKYLFENTTKNSMYLASILRGGENITVYPYNPKMIELKGNFKLATGQNTGLEQIEVYPKK